MPNIGDSLPSSKAPEQQRTCWNPLKKRNKRAYLNRSDAKRALRALKQRATVRDGHVLRVYHCRNCGNYHIGHKGVDP